MHEVLSSNKPYICEVMINPNHKTQPKASVYKKSDGTFCTKPMEDLAPFLPRDEFAKNMLVSIVDE